MLKPVDVVSEVIQIKHLSLVFESLLLTLLGHEVPEDYLILDTYQSAPAWNNMLKVELIHRI